MLHPFSHVRGSVVNPPPKREPARIRPKDMTSVDEQYRVCPAMLLCGMASAVKHGLECATLACGEEAVQIKHN